MYEDYSRQALPPKFYRELLGSALCVFNSNMQFIIENILRLDSAQEQYNWYDLIDCSAGELEGPIKDTITQSSNTKIAQLFCNEIVPRRNRIIHSFQVTDHDEKQILRTKQKHHEQFNITESFLLEFIGLNGELSALLHGLRGF